MDCPRCHGKDYVKDGIVKQRQRYQCKRCAYRYTVAKLGHAKPACVQRQALELYLEGLGFRSIGRLLGVSNVSVLNWIRKFGQQAQRLRCEQPPSVIELDEMHTYIAKKRDVLDRDGC